MVTSAFRDAIQAAQRALTLAAPGSSLLARGFAIWGEALFLQGRYREADTQVTAALHRAQEADDQATTARIVLLLARMAREQGDLPAAQEYYTAVQPLLARLADRPRMALACKDQGTVALDMYDYPRAEAHYQQALDMMREIGDRRGEGMVVSNLGLLRWKQGDMTTAAASYRYDLEICRSTGDQDGELSAYLNLGAVAMDAGEYRTAHAYLHAALTLSMALADQTGIVYAHDVLGLLAHYQGDLTTAAAHYADARQGAQAQNDAIGVLRMDALQGLLAHHQGDHGTAVTLCQHALAQARTCEAVAEEAAAFLYLGHALAAQGHLSIAGDAYRGAASILQTGSPHRLAEAQAGTALVLLHQGQAGAALDVVEKLLVHLAHHPWLPGTDEPLRVWWVCWQVLQHHADPRASTIVEHAYRLVCERAQQVVTGQTETFLALPVHHALVAAWHTHQGIPYADTPVRDAAYYH
jgi:tetratricopeptide (TPR) repeat protein